MTSPASKAASTTPVPRQAWALVASRGVSALGSTLTSFGLNVWVYRETGSYQVFAMLAILAALPSLLFAPFAGYLSDRLDKRRVLLACDLASMFAVAVALAAFLAGQLAVPVVAAVVLVLALATEMRWSSLGPLLSMVVAREHLGRINGMQQAFRGATVMLGPVLGAVGLDSLGLPFLLGLDTVSYLVAIVGLMCVSVPRATSEATFVFRSFWEEMTYGFRWVFERPPLRSLLLFFMAINVGVSILTATFVPYVLSRASAQLLGLGLGLQGAGMFFTGMLLVRHRRKAGVVNHERRVLLGSLALGAGMVAWGLSWHEAALCAVALALGAMTALIMASSQTIWQSHVPVQIQGKVFAVRTVLSFGLAPLSILLSVPLAATVFRPLLLGSDLATSMWGAGEAAALGLMVSTLGAVVVACSIGLLLRGGFRLERTPAVPAQESATA